MSIEEFLDGLPSFDERNFSRFQLKKTPIKRTPVYISTEDKPSDQVIVSDKPHLLLQYLHEKWGKKDDDKKRKQDDAFEDLEP